MSMDRLERSMDRLDWRDVFDAESPGLSEGGLDRYSSPGETLTDASSYFAAVPAEALPLFLKDAWTLMPVVEACDNYELPPGPFTADGPTLADELVPFYLCAEDQRQPIGFLLPRVLQALLDDNAELETMHMQPCWTVLKRGDGSTWAVAIAQWLRAEGHAGLSEHFDRLVRGWRQTGKFASELDGWRDEAYTIYGPARLPSADLSPLPGNNAAFAIERSAAALFSFLTFGVHLTGYVIDPATDQMTIWVPRRSETKQTCVILHSRAQTGMLSPPRFPGMLDQTVAGGITAGLTPFETLVKECGEEASLDPAFVEKHARAAGVVSYTRRSDHGYIQPEVQYCYDLKFPPDGPRPRPNDTEVESFVMMSDREALDAILRGQFKPNCALVLLDFFVRHGRVTAESDTRYLDLVCRLRRRHGQPTPV